MAALCVGDLAKAIDGTVVGDATLAITSVASLADAGPGALSFLANPKYAEALQTTGATTVVVGRDVTEAPCTLIQVENPDLGFAKAVGMILPPPPQPATGVHPSAVVADDARVGEGVSIGATVVVESGATIGDGSVLYPGSYVGHDSRLGKACILYPGARVYYGATLGDRVILQANAVIGSDGFGYAWDGSQHVKIPQVGTVELGDDVEIGACTTIDRARFGTTVIGPGTKLDNQIQIAHNVKVGAVCAFAAQVGISGSTTIGNGVLMGGQTGASGHIEIGDGAVFSAKSGITKSLPGGAHYSGYPARPHRQQLDEWRNVKALSRLRNRLKELEARLASLEEKA